MLGLRLGVVSRAEAQATGRYGWGLALQFAIPSCVVTVPGRCSSRTARDSHAGQSRTAGALYWKKGCNPRTASIHEDFRVEGR